MEPLIKICGLRDAACVEAAVAAGADALGFVFAPSIRRVSARHAARIASGVPRHVLRVAVMLHPTPDEWREVEDIFRPDVLQTDSADFDELNVSADIVRWPVIREAADHAPPQLPHTFVYEGATSGRGQPVDWTVAATLATRGRMILAGGLSCDNIAQAIATVAPFGVDVSSALESSPGVKDPTLIRRFINRGRTSAIL